MRVALGSVALIAALAVPTAVEADPWRPVPPHPREEREMALGANRERQVAHWYEFAEFKTAVAYAEAVEQAIYDRAQAARVAAAVEHYSDDEEEPDEVEPVQGSGRCGGDLPDCSVMECESGGSLTAQNPSSSASGKWQIVDGTWNNYGGYPTAADAPEEVQDAKARELWAESHGHWEQCL